MNIPNKFWNYLIGAVVLLMVFLAVLSVKELKSLSYIGKNPNMSNMITVQGTGEAVSEPDVATFSFSVTETAKTVAEAQNNATAKINSALKVVRDSGVKKEDIQTLSYSINPHFEYQGGVCTAYSCPPSKSVLTGYDVSQSILIKVRDLQKAGDLFTSIGSLGVQNIGGLAFSVDKPEAKKAEARSKAIADAQSKAKILARDLNVSLVNIVSFSEYSNDYPRPYGMGGVELSSVKVQSAIAPEVPAGEQKITSSVSITYEIK